MVRITTLIENSAGPEGTVAEHGLSFFVERDGQALLFDTGQSGAFLDNARVLRVDVRRAEALVVSHGHYDHSGGLRRLLEGGGFRGPLYTGPGFLDRKWSDEAPAPRYNGVDFDAAYLEERGTCHEQVAAAGEATVIRELLPGVYAVNGFPRIHHQEQPNSRFVVDRATGRVRDDFSDELCLAIDLPEGVAVLLGCAHPGMMNMLAAVQKAFGKQLYAVLGGSHLVEADGDRLNASVAYLARTRCHLAALGHCTGPVGVAALAAGLHCYRPLATGARYEW